MKRTDSTLFSRMQQLTISVPHQILNNRILSIGPITNTQPSLSLNGRTPQSWIMYDPDAPFPQTYPPAVATDPLKTKSAYLHWVHEKGVDLVPFAPPSPPSTSPPHRYVFVSYYGTLPSEITRKLQHGLTNVSALFQWIQPESIAEFSAVQRSSANQNPYDAKSGDFSCLFAPQDELICGEPAFIGDPRSPLEKIASCIFQVKARIGNDIRLKGWTKYSAGSPFAICQARLKMGIGAVAFRFRPEVLNSYDENQLRGWIIYEANFASDARLSREIFERGLILMGKRSDFPLETKVDWLSKYDLIQLILRYWHCKPLKIDRQECVTRR